ncbi:MAG: polyribonucleotide nucleotidyltransferase [Candidatus Paceibacterota bacterium]
MAKEYSLKVKDKEIKVEFNDLAEQANGSVMIKLKETVVLTTAVMALTERPELDFFPLLVDYEEKYYAAGKIYGSRFLRRESRPTEIAILVARLIDRTIRPLFPEMLRRDVQVVASCLSIDEENDPDILAILGASLALSVSDIPFEGPVSAVRVGWSKEKGFLINPTYKEREECSLDVVFAGKGNRINMIEGIAKEVSEEILVEAFQLAKKEIENLNYQQEKIIEENKKEKDLSGIKSFKEDLLKEMEAFGDKKLEEIIFNSNKIEKGKLLTEFKEDLKNYLNSKGYLEEDLRNFELCFNKILRKTIHQYIIEKEIRPDGRSFKEIRALEMAIDILPRPHGSAVFKRGLTHVLSTVTLGSPSDVLLIQGIEFAGEKRFLHHYNFPGYSSGEVAPLKGPGRREIGHGALAEKALSAVIPSKEEFPYTIRVVSEVLSSNGSTSMASVCASSLALMAAGVPIKTHVAGIAMGLMTDENNYKILTDIQGPEDHFGDMDCKVAGTEKGITAIQMDLKISGIDEKIFSETLAQAKEARDFILEEMKKVIEKPRENISPYAPRIFIYKIKPEQIGELIGPGGKTIQAITRETGVTIDIEEDGTLYITAPDKEKSELALNWIKEITKEFSEGEIVEGKVAQIRDFGAIIDLGHQKSGLLHISEFPFRVKRIEDLLKIGDVLKLKIKKIEANGKVSLSLKDLKFEPPKKFSKEKRFFRRK